MKLVVGLGNPGRRYRKTRHNVGFMFVDQVAKEYNAKFTLDKKTKSQLCEINIDGEKVILAKPQTYMNLSGEAVLAIVKYYKINIDDLLVVYDDLDLNLAQVKIKPSGSSAGHKNMENIIKHLHTNEIKRVRIGIGKNRETNDHVLGKFTKDEAISIDLVLTNAKKIVSDFVMVGFDVLMNNYNGKF